MSAAPLLSLCMIVKNEAENLRQCLHSVASLNPQIVLADTGSTDGTPEVAAAYRATIVPFDFTTIHFAAARNHSLSLASGRWILVLDADETLQPSANSAIRAILSTNRNDGYFLQRHNHSAGSPPAIDHVLRLFPNRPCYRFRGRVHETIDQSLLAAGARLVETEIPIHHNFAPDAATRRRKNQRYIQILKEEIAADPADSSRLDFLAAEYHQLEMYAEACAVTEAITRLRPLDARAHLFAGAYYLLYQPDFARANHYLQQALLLKPNYAEAYSFLRLLAQKQEEQARI